MWVITNREGKFEGVIVPTRGKDNLAYQLRKVGMLPEGAELEGGGYARRIVASGKTTHYLVKLPQSLKVTLMVKDLAARLEDTQNEANQNEERNHV